LLELPPLLLGRRLSASAARAPLESLLTLLLGLDEKPIRRSLDGGTFAGVAFAAFGSAAAAPALLIATARAAWATTAAHFFLELLNGSQLLINKLQFLLNHWNSQQKQPIDESPSATHHHHATAAESSGRSSSLLSLLS
jgi:hypothetical protein